MRRGSRLPGLMVVLAASLTGSGVTASGATIATDPVPLGARGRSVIPTRTGMMDDIRAAPNTIYVGSARGVIYAVEASF